MKLGKCQPYYGKQIIKDGKVLYTDNDPKNSNLDDRYLRKIGKMNLKGKNKSVKIQEERPSINEIEWKFQRIIKYLYNF